MPSRTQIDGGPLARVVLKGRQALALRLERHGLVVEFQKLVANPGDDAADGKSGASKLCLLEEGDGGDLRRRRGNYSQKKENSSHF